MLFLQVIVWSLKIPNDFWLFSTLGPMSAIVSWNIDTTDHVKHPFH